VIQTRGLCCVRCEATLELPADPDAVYVNCPFCGQDNLLPPDVVAERQRARADEVRERLLELETARLADARRSQRRRTTIALLVAAGVSGVVALLCAGPVVTSFVAAIRNGSMPARTPDASANGSPAVTVEVTIRSHVDNDVATGRVRMTAILKQLYAAGCTSVVFHPEVVQDTQSYEITSTEGGNCYNFLAVSHYPDATFSFDLESPLGERLPVPAPSSEARLIYCPRFTGKHKLQVTPRTRDHFTVAAVDCPRRGPEGLTREKELLAKVRGRGR
jgi:hypothetical protein